MTLPWVERALLRVAPRWGLRRLRDRLAGDLLLRSFDAAAMTARTSFWRRTLGDGNTERRRDLVTTRALARNLLENNPYARAAMTAVVDHVVGWGITAKSGPSAFGGRWKAWTESTACDADGRLDFSGIQQQVMRTIFESGEILIRRRIRRVSDGLPIPLQLQLLEPDYLDHTKEGATESGGWIIQGVEFNPIGQRIQYWLFPSHPGSSIPGVRGSGYSPSVPIPASEVLHIGEAGRPGQVRCTPWLAPVIPRLEDLGEYEDATLMKQKIAACLALILTDPDGGRVPLGLGDDSTIPGTDTLRPGMIASFPQGTAEVVQPPSVNEYAPYVSTGLRAIATGLGVSYEDLTGDYCVSPETRILRADLRWVRAEQLVEGESIVAFDEFAPGGQGHRRKWRTATVDRAGLRVLPRYRIVTDRASVSVTGEHRFLCVGQAGAGMAARSDSGSAARPGRGQMWVRADRLKPGDRIVFLAEPWEEGHSHLHGYLKGITDGEGWLDRRNARIGIAQNPGPVFDEIGEALRILGFKTVQSAANGNGTGNRQWQTAGIAQCLRFLGEVRPTRLLKMAASVYEGRMIAGGSKRQGIPTYATVQQVDVEGPGQVVTLATSTKTLVTEGLCSHNSQVNFSSARMSRLRHYDRVNAWRWRMLQPQFLDPVWSWAVQFARVVDGRVPERLPAAWTAPPMPMLEPDKEGLAYSRLIRNLLMSQSEALRELGYDPETVIAEIAADAKRLDRLGLISDSDPRVTTQGGQLQGQAVPEPAPAAAATPTPPPAPDDESAADRRLRELTADVIRHREQLARLEGQLEGAARNGHAPAIHVDARTNIEKGAVEVPVDARTTIAEGAIRAGDVLVEAPTTVAPAEVRIEKGAVEVQAPVTLAPGAVTVPVTVADQVTVPAGRKRIKRDDKGRIKEIIDEGQAGQVVNLSRDADGRLDGAQP